MADHHGVGIAANQIGSNKRVCLVRQTLMINPTFEPVTEETWIDKEGCLSCGETEDRPHYQVERFKHVLVRYNDLRGGTQHATFHDFDARIVQHEIAHLDGRTIIEDQLKKT
jgi:peptide deformylase